MRIFYVPSNISIENLRHIFLAIYQDVTPTKMSPPPHPLSKTTFFPRPAAHPLKIRKQNRLSKFKKKHNHTNTHTKSKQKSKPNTSNHKNQKQTPQKDNPKQSIKLHQLENTPTQTAIQIQQTTSQIPLRNHTPQNARTFPLKRKCISLQTPKSSLPNASAFHLKYKDV